ncbi:MAG: alcohol dehydrogenase, partial [Alphaproteobacteria bacterium]
DVHAAPLLCAGLIGYRSYRMIEDALAVGIYGFGAAAHILCQLMVAEGRRVHAFTRPGDKDAQDFARRLGAVWAGDSTRMPPEPLDAALIFAPVGALVPAALKAVRPGGRVICGGIHMSDIPGFAYRDLWGERTIASVANLTRADADAFLGRARQLSIATHVTPFALEEANAALEALRRGQLQGAAVLVIGGQESR